MTIASASSSRYDSAATAPMGMSLGMATQQSKRFSREYWQRELEALLRVHEPTRVHTSTDLLDAYEGMERELVQCYRHYYTGEGGFRVTSTASPGPTFSLPREAIDTYLRVKLRARRSLSFASKGDGVRDVEAPVPSPTSAASRAPRQRAASASAVRTHF